MKRVPSVRATLVAACMVGTLGVAGSASAQDTPLAAKAPDPMQQIADLRASLAALEAKRTEETKSSAAEARFRLIRYGISVGVAATIYAPGFAGNTIDGVAGGAMPFFGFFPAYWGQNAAKNTYCSLEWSAPDAAAVASAESVAANESGASSADTTQADEAKGTAEAKVAAAEGAAQDQVKAEAELDRAKTQQETVNSLKQEGITDLTAKATDVAKEVKERTDAKDEAAATTKKKAEEAKAAVDQYKQALVQLSKDADRRFDGTYASQQEDRAEKLVAQLKKAAQEANVTQDDIDALTAVAERHRGATCESDVGAHPLAQYLMTGDVAKLKEQAKKAAEDAKAAEAKAQASRAEATVREEAAKNAADGEKAAANSAAAAAKTKADQDETAAAANKGAAKTSAENLKKAWTVPALLCALADAHADVVSLEKKAFSFSGPNTSCLTRKFGFYVGYPAMFNATTLIESRTPINRVERDITPIISAGFIAAPNAIVAFTVGPWFGNTKIEEDRHDFVWGFHGGVALTGDVLPALAD